MNPTRPHTFDIPNTMKKQKKQNTRKSDKCLICTLVDIWPTMKPLNVCA